MPPETADSAAHKEDHILLAIKTIKNDQISRIKAAAAAYNIPLSTLKHCIYRHTACVDVVPNSQKIYYY